MIDTQESIKNQQEIKCVKEHGDVFFCYALINAQERPR